VDRRRLVPIFLIVFVNFLGGTLVLPILPLYAKQRFNAPVETITLLNASFFAAQFIAGPIMGRLSDKYGRLPLLIVSQLGTVASFIMIALAQDMTGLFVARILDGITGGNVIVAQAYITDITPREKRTQALGVIFAAFGLGYIFGPAVGGGLAVFGAQVAFIVGAVISLITVILTWVMLDESLPRESRLARRAPKHRMKASDILGNPALILILVIAFATQFSMSLFQSTFSLFGEAVIFKGSPENTIGLGVGVLLGGIGVGQVLTQWVLIRPLIARYGEHKLVIIGDLLRGFGFLTLTFLISPWLIGLVSLMAFAIGSGMMMPSLQSLTTMSVPEEISGGVLGVYQSSTSLGIILGSAISGWLFASSPTTPYLVGGAIYLLLVPLAVMLMRQGQAKPAAVQSQVPA